MTTTADRLAESLIIAALSDADGGMTRAELLELPWYVDRHQCAFRRLMESGSVVERGGKFLAASDAERMAKAAEPKQRELF